MNLPTEVRYRPYADWTDEEKTKIRENVAKSPWRASYHIEPETGLLNDPNGFSYFNGKFQLFYQSWPFGAAHGLKQWVHTETEDLVHFTETGVKLLPDHENDSTVPTQVLLIKSVINSLSSILGTFVMKTGFVTHVKSALGWIKTAKSKNSTRFLSNNLLTLLGTSVTLKSSITRDNSTLS